MASISVKLGELRRSIVENNEFKPVVFGDKETAKINKEAYADIKKETSKLDGGLTAKKEATSGGINGTGARGMSDLEYDRINKDFVDRAEANMKGYPSKEAEKLHKDDPFGNAEFSDKAYKDAKEHSKVVKDLRDQASEIGLTGRMINKKDIEDNSKNMFGESKKIKRLSFNKVRFVNEEHMMQNIPDDYKREGSKFIMRDMVNNEYLVEWKSVEPKVTKKINMTLVNEEKDRIKHLFGYKSSEQFQGTTPSMRLAEERAHIGMLNRMKELMKD